MTASRLVTSVILALASPAGLALAQQDLSKVEIGTTELGAGLAMLTGAGGNIGVSVGDDGVLLVDDQFAPLADRIRAAVAALSKEPIRFVLNTHFHGDHSGGNDAFGATGALLLAHDRVRERMSIEQVRFDGQTSPPRAEEAWPVLTWKEGITLHLNGQTIDVRNVAPAHTDGDSIVRFVEADVLHLGDTFFAGAYPFIDLSSGGGIDGMVAAVDVALGLCGPETRIIPGHGALSGRADLRAYHEMLSVVRDRVAKMVERGLDRDTVLRAKPSAGFDAAFGGGLVTPDRFVGFVYDSLVADR